MKWGVLGEGGNENKSCQIPCLEIDSSTSIGAVAVRPNAVTKVPGF